MNFWVRRARPWPTTALCSKRAALGMLLALTGAAACGGDDGSGEASAGQGGGASGTGASGSGASGSGASGTGAAGGASGAGAGRGAAGAAGEDAGGGAGGGGAFTGQTGVCGQRGMSMVDDGSFAGFEEYYLIGEEGFGEDICVVRFEVTRVGEAPEGCVDPATAEVDCSWTHLVEFSNPTTVTDEGGVCANSELGLDAAAIDEIDGSQVAYGFVSEFAGHDSVAMKYDEASQMWKAFGNGTWDEAAGSFRFDRRDGLCDY